ncbi:LysR family transcriptional regulator (plasmid) [Sphingomonas aliaeris]|uniref:LysR family transcriptional regulator n=1 Tax=Sphingomonas aliaeris TaxID=2759526 RepID=A0A974NYH7_9SPHN|nr:LysR family transcriptional regulator [Sphingomonas aliaeris]QQV79429.1 LysR family transcriptional regulator [Sphingomonas aliaeris]
MRFKGMDLNLFVAFDALMETRNTARAAERLGLSQPAASAALARLRDYFRDDLLVVKGRRMYPTPLAETLLPRIRQCLRDAEAVIATTSQFDPATAERRFRIVSSDYVVTAILAPLSRAAALVAPGIQFQFTLVDETVAEQLRRGEADLIISPAEWALPAIPTEPLYEERYVLAGWREHPIFKAPLSEEAIFAYPHVTLSVGSSRAATVGDKQFELLGRPRRVEVIASSFSSLPWLLIGTERLALMHERLALAAAHHFPIAHAQLPFPFAPLRQLVQYHETRIADQGVRWLIEQIRAQADSTTEPTDG